MNKLSAELQAFYVDGLNNSYCPSLKRLATHTAGYEYLLATLWDGVKSLLLENKKEDKGCLDMQFTFLIGTGDFAKGGFKNAVT